MKIAINVALGFAALFCVTQGKASFVILAAVLVFAAVRITQWMES